jgi:D-lactate dehydrogenase (cytochrome)
MQLEHGESYELMKQIKSLIDPKGLMNPGKIF